MSLLSHGFALVLYGVGIKTASVSSRGLLTAAARGTSVSLHSLLVGLWDVGDEGSLYLAAMQKSTFHRSRAPLSVCAGVDGADSGDQPKRGQPVSTMQKYKIHQLRVELRRNGPTQRGF